VRRDPERNRYDQEQRPGKREAAINKGPLERPRLFDGHSAHHQHAQHDSAPENFITTHYYGFALDIVLRYSK
jgi:hypothetical protein